MDVSHRLAQRVGAYLKERELVLATAESCTGGWVAQVITSIPGSSAWFDRGYVSYSDLAKRELLGVSAQSLNRHGSVSEKVAREMAEGGLKRSQGDVCVAISGIAGPDGGTPVKPVGSIWLAWAMRDHETRVRYTHFVGDREMVRQQAVMAALQGIIDAVENKQGRSEVV